MYGKALSVIEGMILVPKIEGHWITWLAVKYFVLIIAETSKPRQC